MARLESARDRIGSRWVREIVRKREVLSRPRGPWLPRVELGVYNHLKHRRNRRALQQRDIGAAGPTGEPPPRGRWLLRVALLLVSVACVFAASCDKSKNRPAGEPQDSGVARGDYVVVEPEAARFFEARVLSVDGSRLRVQRVEGGDSAMVAIADVYRLPPRHDRFSAGDFAICRTREARWMGCRIESASSQAIIARKAEGERLEVDASGMIFPNSVTELNLRRDFERVERRAEFQRQVAEAGVPRAPPSWRPSVRDRVVVRDESGWYSATVSLVEDGGVDVAWHGDQRISRVTRAVLVPEPANSQVFQRGQFALLRPSGPAEPWQPVRIESTRGGALSVVDINGQRRTASPRDLIPLLGADEG